MKIRYVIFLLGLTMLFAGVSFAGTATDPMIIFGNPEPDPVSQRSCTFDNSCGFMGSVNPDIAYTNDSGMADSRFEVTIDSEFTPPLTCEINPNEPDTAFNTAALSGTNSCIFSFQEPTFASFADPFLAAGANYDIQYVGFDCPFDTCTYDFKPTPIPSVPEPNSFVLLGTGLAALLAVCVGGKRVKGVGLTSAS